MPEISSANYVFLPWVRQGAAAGIQTPDRSPQQAGVVSVTVQAARQRQVERRPAGAPVRPGRCHRHRSAAGGTHGAAPSGHGFRAELLSGRSSSIVRTFPGSSRRRRQMPPATLRPWLCLVVVRKQEGVTLRADRNLPLPVLEIDEPARPERRAAGSVRVVGVGARAGRRAAGATLFRCKWRWPAIPR